MLDQKNLDNSANDFTKALKPELVELLDENEITLGDLLSDTPVSIQDLNELTPKKFQKLITEYKKEEKELMDGHMEVARSGMNPENDEDFLLDIITKELD